MAERILNLFVGVDGETVREIGVALHDADGTDYDKFILLKSLVDSDHTTATRWKT